MLVIHRFGKLREVNTTILQQLLQLVKQYIVEFQYDFNYIPIGRQDEHCALSFLLSTIRPCFNNNQHHTLLYKIVDVMVRKGKANEDMAIRFKQVNRALSCRCEACIFASVIPSRSGVW